MTLSAEIISIYTLIFVDVVDVVAGDESSGGGEGGEVTQRWNDAEVR